MFTVYLDESYGDANAYAVAGYVAPDEQWHEFEREWSALCSEVNVRYIHKRHLEHLWGEFRYAQHWPKDKQTQLKIAVNRKACNIISRRLNAGFAAAVCKSDWLEADKGRWSSVLGESFYAAGVFTCFHLIATWMQHYKPTEHMNYILEQGADGRKEVERVLKMTESSVEGRALSLMNKWAFASKHETVVNNVTVPPTIALQAADFLAYEIYRQMDNRGFEGVKYDSHGNEIPTRRVLLTLMQRDQPKYSTLHASRLPTPYFLLFVDKTKTAQMVQWLDEIFPES